MLWSLPLSIFVEFKLLLLVVDNVSAEEECIFGGQIFQAGESLGNTFTTRCGSASEFPCYCNPQADPPIDCPYCGIATLDDVLVCGQVGEENISVVNLQGVPQDCSCQIDPMTGQPKAICNDDVCTLELDDGTVELFSNGESFENFLTTRCGSSSEYPCFCNTALPNQIDCPYCGFVTITGDLTCARVDETIIYQNSDNQQIQCTCREDLSSDCGEIITTNHPTLRPTQRPTHSQTKNPTEIPIQPSTLNPALSPFSQPPETMQPTVTPIITPTRSPTKEPTSESSTTSPSSATMPTKPGFDKPTVLLPNRPPVMSPGIKPLAPTSPPLEGCMYRNTDDGSTSFVQAGESFGKHVTGPCTSWEDWPTFCNPEIPGNKEYPYCAFSPSGQVEDEDGNASSLVCAQSGARVLVPTSDGSITDCSCLFLNPAIGPASSCPDLMIDLAFPTTSAPTNVPSKMPLTQSPTNDLPSKSPSSRERSSSSPPSSLPTKIVGCLVALFGTVYWNGF